MAALHGRGAEAFLRHRSEIACVASHQAGFGLGVQRGDHPLEVARPQQVVAVEQRDVGCAGPRDRPVAGTGHAAVPGFEKADPRIGQVRQHRTSGVVGRAVVDHPALPLAEGLRQHGIERLADEMRHAIGGHDHRDAGSRRADRDGRVHAPGD